MFRRNLFHVWFGIVILSCVFFAAQAWAQCTEPPDCSADGLCNPLCAAGADPDCGGPSGPWPVLNTGKDVMAILSDDAEVVHASIWMEVIDRDGNPDTFSVVSDNTCVTVTADEVNRELDITVPVAAEPCNQSVTINSGSGLTKDIAIKVIDPMVMDIGDGLLIQFRNEYSRQWTRQAVDPHLSTWYALPGAVAEGWRSITGTQASGQLWDPDPIPFVSVKQRTAADLIRAPTSYSMIAGSLSIGYDPSMGDAVLKVYKPNCDPGYVALSSHTCYGSQEAPCMLGEWNDTYCVKEQYTLPGKVVKKVRDFSYYCGLFCASTGSVWEITFDDSVPVDAGYAPLQVGGYVWCTGTDSASCDMDMVNVLKVPLEIIDKHSVDEEHTSYALANYPPSYWFPLDRPYFGSTVRVPFTFIAHQVYEGTDPDECDAACLNENVLHYPFWAISRTEGYKLIQQVNNKEEPQETTVHIGFESGWETATATNYQTTVGIDTTYSAECGLSIGPLSGGASISISLSEELSWGGDHTDTDYGRVTIDTTSTCPPYSNCQYFTLYTDFATLPIRCMLDHGITCPGDKELKLSGEIAPGSDEGSRRTFWPRTYQW